MKKYSQHIRFFIEIINEPQSSGLTIYDPGYTYISRNEHRLLSREIHQCRLILEKIQSRLTQLENLGTEYSSEHGYYNSDDNGGILEITEDMKIIFKGKEVKLTPLTRSLFIVFANHPEGINFKDISEYRDELLSVYTRISGWDDIQKCENTISRLLNPDSNSIDTQRYLLRRQLEEQLSAEDAAQLNISGKKGQKKFIPLRKKK